MTTKKKPAAKPAAKVDQAELDRLHKIEGLYRDLKATAKDQAAELAELRAELEAKPATTTAAAISTAELPRGGDLASVASMARDLAGIPQDVLEELDRLRHVKGLYENLLADLAKIDAVDGYTRGKLPDGRYIKIDVRTGAFTVISLEEWNRIPAG